MDPLPPPPPQAKLIVFVLFSLIRQLAMLTFLCVVATLSCLRHIIGFSSQNTFFRISLIQIALHLPRLRDERAARVCVINWSFHIIIIRRTVVAEQMATMGKLRKCADGALLRRTMMRGCYSFCCSRSNWTGEKSTIIIGL
jgi:hypothetical protein